MECLSSEVRTLLSQYPSLEYSKEKNRIICKWTNHELPIDSPVPIESYVKGRRYQRLKERNQDFDSETLKLIENFMPCKEDNGKKVYCILTGRYVANRNDQILAHVKGKYFSKRLAVWKACQEQGTIYCLEDEVHISSDEEMDEMQVDTTEPMDVD
ncbi:hypothetical protein ACOME3_005216 [Neoechinorhynchus agilis]